MLKDDSGLQRGRFCSVKVIHSVDEYLSVTQPWAYQQITRVPGVQAAVICSGYLEPEEFPIDAGALFL
jgi:hypothetical protein